MGEFYRIIKDGIDKGKPYSDINKELKKAGANFHLEENGKTGWTDQEMEEGFIRVDDGVVYPNLHDLMKYDANKAGHIETHMTKHGKYEIVWDENGRPVKASHR